jgi:L-asparaginase II
MHNNCSGKHTGFLMLTQAMGAGPEYTEVDHPLQRAIRAATEEVTGQAIAGHGIDGCSAPNFAVTVTGLARAMAAFAAATGSGDTRDRAMARLRDAMRTHPVLVGGEGDACTDLMRAVGVRGTVKSAADGVFVAILTDQKRGVALKIEDGGARGRDAAMTALLLRLGALEGGHSVVGRLLTGPQRNWRGLAAAELRLAAEFA